MAVQVDVYIVGGPVFTTITCEVPPAKGDRIRFPPPHNFKVVAEVLHQLKPGSGAVFEYCIGI